MTLTRKQLLRIALIVAVAAPLALLIIRSERAMPLRRKPAVPAFDGRGVATLEGATDHVWYVDPFEGERAFLGAADDAEAVIRRFGRDTNNVELSGILPKVLDSDPRPDEDGDGVPDEVERLLGTATRDRDSDKDGVDDGEELRRGGVPTRAKERAEADRDLVERKKGAILLQGSGGRSEAWYVNPLDGARYHLGSGADAFSAFRAFARTIDFDIWKSIKVSEKSPSWLLPPEGYVSEIVAAGFARPRVLAWDPAGRLVVADYAERSRVLAYADRDKDGGFEERSVIVSGFSHGLSNLFNSHGLAFLKGRFYVASEHVLEYWPYDDKTGAVSGKSVKVMDLPPGGETFPGQGHRTRTIAAGKDGKLYLSVGSSCDHCGTLDADTYSVLKRLDPDGKTVETVARGLRNTVFFVQHPKTSEWWGNDMGRDDLGDDLPPDELNILLEGGAYGWPYCYGKGIAAPDAPDPEACKGMVPPQLEYPAHSAPLGLRFVPRSFLADWEDDLLVAHHGSTVKEGTLAGYAIVRVDMDGGRPTGGEEAIGGFLRPGKIVVGRPVDLLFSDDGALYVTDDYANVVHRVRKKR